MSANPAARPQSRRAILAGLSTLPAIGAAAVAAETDPIFAVLEIERQAWDAYGAAISRRDDADTAWWASEWHRKPRVQVGTMTAFVRGPDFEPIPESERTAEPVYLHSVEEIERHHPFVSDAEHRRQLRHELQEDERAIEAHPLHVAARLAEEAQDAAHDVWADAYEAALGIQPTTAAGAQALLSRFLEREHGCMVECSRIKLVLDAVHPFIGGRA